MSSAINRNIGIVLILCFFFGFSAKAQLASSKPLTAFYNNKINEVLGESTATKISLKSQKQNLPSNELLIKNLANLKVKNPAIILHKNAAMFTQINKIKLPANSTELKQKGYPGSKPNNSH